MESETQLTTAQAAERLGVSRRQVQSLIQSGDLHAVKWGRDYQLSSADVAAYQRQPRGWPKGRKRGA